MDEHRGVGGVGDDRIVDGKCHRGVELGDGGVGICEPWSDRTCSDVWRQVTVARLLREPVRKR